MKTTISPSILGGSFSNMEKTISELDVSNAEYIHFDVMDGDFVPNLTFGPQFISDLRLKTNKIFDVHLMIHRVDKFLNDYIKAGSNIITFHYEIDENINHIIDKINHLIDFDHKTTISKPLIKYSSGLLPAMDGIAHHVLTMNQNFINFILDNDVLSLEIKKKLVLFSIQAAQNGDNTGSAILQFYYDMVNHLL